MPQHRYKKQTDKLPRRQGGGGGTAAAAAPTAADDGTHAWQRSQGAFSAKAKKVRQWTAESKPLLSFCFKTGSNSSAKCAVAPPPVR
jgi:hypothetical protein